MNDQTQWEKMIEVLLKDKNPCRLCAVQVMCRKSFALRNGGGCPELKELLEKALDIIGDENENKK
jgi:hypothetical protein